MEIITNSHFQSFWIQWSPTFKRPGLSKTGQHQKNQKPACIHFELVSIKFLVYWLKSLFKLAILETENREIFKQRFSPSVFYRKAPWTMYIGTQWVLLTHKMLSQRKHCDQQVGRSKGKRFQRRLWKEYDIDGRSMTQSFDEWNEYSCIHNENIRWI